ncbi:hypothetical protein RB195_017907 [Necator americanus]|uniref:Uncharacterized protein n=1 Tax=Necator americanus TaxID=51031 RepID=A0ABR1C9D3_NECAM
MASYETAFWGRLFAVMQGEMPLDSPTSDYDCQEELKFTVEIADLSWTKRKAQDKKWSRHDEERKPSE